jgi:ribosomal protein S14
MRYYDGSHTKASRYIQLESAKIMSGPLIAGKTASLPARPFDFGAIPPTLLKREPAPRRTKIWEFNTNLHCSIIGTCLSTGELRSVLRKFGLASPDATDHELHGIAVSLAGRHDDAAKQLHKALDHRHKLAVSQFGKAATADTVRSMWREAARRGDIPGAYWATLTHPLTNQTLVREAFGEVHMLSHLVGSANRADISRLCVLEAEKAELQAKTERQQQALHDAVVSRDTIIRDLRQALADRIVTEPAPLDDGVLHALVADRETRLGAEIRRRAALEERLALTLAERDRERAARVAAERGQDALQRELHMIEASLTARPGDTPALRLEGVVLLYVGGRPNQVAHMRMMVEQRGALFLHHDGGVENHQNLLPGLISRCDFALFPVDCISHDAAGSVKSLCRQAGKRFVPLRSASATSLLAALHASEPPRIADAAD